MFFGNSRISFIKNLVSLIGNATDNNYVITFIDESVSDYTNAQGTSIGPYWQEDYENFLVTMEGKNSNSYIVFDIETQGSTPDYIWAENSSTSLPFSSDNIVNIFRPNSGTQQEFYETVLMNLESRWGNSIWQHLVDNDLKLLIVVDVSGSMDTSLIQGALNTFQGFLNEKGVQSYILDGCQNERWLAWGSAAYHDGENAGCSASCLYGKRCHYICNDEISDCYGAQYTVCIPPFIYSNGSVVENECQPYCSSGDAGPGQLIFPLEQPIQYVGEVICGDFGGGAGLACAQQLCELSEDSWCVGCSFGNNTWCDACVPCKEGNYQHKCVKCHYLSADQFDINPPSFSYGISFCGIASCSVTSGTYFGMTSWNEGAETWSWINATHTTENPTTLWGRDCHPYFQDDSSNCGVCPATTISGDILWEIEVCDEGCSNCAQGLTAYFPNGVLGFVWTSQYNVCNLGCTS